MLQFHRERVHVSAYYIDFSVWLGRRRCGTNKQTHKLSFLYTYINMGFSDDWLRGGKKRVRHIEPHRSANEWAIWGGIGFSNCRIWPFRTETLNGDTRYYQKVRQMGLPYAADDIRLIQSIWTFERMKPEVDFNFHHLSRLFGRQISWKQQKNILGLISRTMLERVLSIAPHLETRFNSSPSVYIHCTRAFYAQNLPTIRCQFHC